MSPNATQIDVPPGARFTRTTELPPLPAMLAAVADPGSLEPLGEIRPCGAAGALAMLGGTPVVLYATDSEIRGGTLSPEGCDRIVQAIDVALDRDVPVVGLWRSGGASLHDGVLSLDGVGRIFSAIVRASGRVPQLSIIDGPAAGGAAYGAALTDVVVLTDQARAFVTGPKVVGEVTGQRVDARDLGGPEQHGRRSGVAHLCVDTLEDAGRVAGELVGLLSRPGEVDLDTVAGPQVDPGRHVPADPRRVYDVRAVVDDLLDAPALVLQPRFAANVLTAFGRVAGRTVGVVANNPRRLGGCLDSASGEKAARFVRLCDAFGVPLLVLVDVPGYLPGVEQERIGVLRRGAKLLHAFAAAQVPRITVLVRKAYGGAFVAMNSRGLGADRVLAWPTAELGVMNDLSAVRILHRRALAGLEGDALAALEAELVAEHRAKGSPLDHCLGSGLVDEVVEPVATRQAVAAHLHALGPARRAALTNIPL
ncbi:MAG TPA: carboxyl transferase domain-containing protein [Solirubrobacteraceae bacterium]|nr:carboxyl transferase domain-containing protein [Solirubrobacteraceae bacterium]